VETSSLLGPSRLIIERVTSVSEFSRRSTGTKVTPSGKKRRLFFVKKKGKKKKRKPTTPNIQLGPKPNPLPHFHNTARLFIITKPLDMEHQHRWERFDEDLLLCVDRLWLRVDVDRLRLGLLWVDFGGLDL